MLVLDGHSSHATAELIDSVQKKNIIPLYPYMLPHSSHLLQPLDVSCFSPLNRLYNRGIADMMQNGINTINKAEFLYKYPAVHQQAL